MNTLIDNEPTEQDLSHRGMHTYNDTAANRENDRDNDREISLGTSTILGIFFALAVLCALFFGFGYSLGAKHTPAPVVAAAPIITSSAFSGFKPAPGSPLALPSSKAPAPETVVVPNSAIADSASPSPTATVKAPFNPDAHIVGDTEAPAAGPSGRPLQAESPAALPATSTSLQFLVQVAAVSHREDADLIASTLKRRGYAVAIRTEPQDKLLHVQIGPFTTRKDADTMRQRLLADGFNAYIK